MTNAFVTKTHQDVSRGPQFFGLARRFAVEALFHLGHDRGQIGFLHTAQRGQRNESESTRKPRRRGYLPDAQDPVAQGRIERLTGETTLVEAGELSRIRTAVQQDQQGAYRQADAA